MSDSFDSAYRSLKERKPAPVYFFHGEESFFTDRLTELVESYLPENERTFNMFSLYPLEREPEDVMELARRFPLMSEKIIVIVKEAQTARGGAGKWINRLSKYAANPSSTTILAVIARGTKVSCKEFTDSVKKGGGIVVESSKIKDSQLTQAVGKLIKDEGLNYENQSISIIVDNIGNDLSRIYNEICKLKLILPPGATVTPESIEKNIGISREYNNFELVRALSRRDAVKALKIIRHFNANQRENPWVLTLSTVYNLFANTLVAQYTDRTDSSIMKALALRNSFALADYKNAMANYSPAQVLQIIRLIRKADAHGKGNGSRLPVETVMENLILEILLATGKLN